MRKLIINKLIINKGAFVDDLVYRRFRKKLEIVSTVIHYIRFKNDVLKLHANPPIPKYVEAQLHKPKVENSSGSCSGSKSKQQNSRR